MGSDSWYWNDGGVHPPQYDHPPLQDMQFELTEVIAVNPTTMVKDTAGFDVWEPATHDIHGNPLFIPSWPSKPSSWPAGYNPVPYHFPLVPPPVPNGYFAHNYAHGPSPVTLGVWRDYYRPQGMQSFDQPPPPPLPPNKRRNRTFIQSRPIKLPSAPNTLNGYQLLSMPPPVPNAFNIHQYPYGPPYGPTSGAFEAARDHFHAPEMQPFNQVPPPPPGSPPLPPPPPPPPGDVAYIPPPPSPPKDEPRNFINVDSDSSDMDVESIEQAPSPIKRFTEVQRQQLARQVERKVFDQELRRSEPLPDLNLEVLAESGLDHPLDIPQHDADLSNHVNHRRANNRSDVSDDDADNNPEAAASLMTRLKRFDKDQHSATFSNSGCSSCDNSGRLKGNRALFRARERRRDRDVKRRAAKAAQWNENRAKRRRIGSPDYGTFGHVHGRYQRQSQSTRQVAHLLVDSTNISDRVASSQLQPRIEPGYVSERIWASRLRREQLRKASTNDGHVEKAQAKGRDGPMEQLRREFQEHQEKLGHSKRLSQPHDTMENMVRQPSADCFGDAESGRKLIEALEARVDARVQNLSKADAGKVEAEKQAFYRENGMDSW